MIQERRQRKDSFFDPKTGLMTVKVLPGEHYVSADPVEIIVTVLGSCVSACIRDPETGIGGMNHFMLPGDINTVNAGRAMRFGHFAMEVLINDIVKTGCPRDRLEIKLFGGATVIGSGGGVGMSNVEFVKKYLANEGLHIAAEDLGGEYARRIHYSPSTGKVDRLLLRRTADRAIFREEEKFKGKISEKVDNSGGSIELFD